MTSTNACLEAVERLVQRAGLVPRPDLAPLLCGPTGKTTAGYPFVADETFRAFLERIPHLFRDGRALADWLTTLASALGEEDALPGEFRGDVERSLRVLRNVVYTAGITAPPDLWILRHVLSVHQRTGLIARLAERPVKVSDLADGLGLDAKHLTKDLALLRSRGLIVGREEVTLANAPQAQAVATMPELPLFPADMVPALKAALQGERRDDVEPFLALREEPRAWKGWMPGPYEIELGFRLVPLVLAMRALEKTEPLKRGVMMRDVLPKAPEGALALCAAAGLVDEAGRVTLLGARVFARGPGPFGIIHAYHSYVNRLEDLARGRPVSSWVARGENVAASQDANRKTFKMANDALDAFCAKTGFAYRVFVEHAVGQGEATRQRYERSGATDIQYFGADLEDAAVDKAVEAQKAGALPANMIFVRRADIGKPEALLEGIKAAGFSPDGAVMMVGNGFHEVRNQSDEKMIEVFRGYREAGILLLFTEESGLSDEDLLATGWNTYHAGFRYVHELSGQGLRPATDTGEGGGRKSWSACAKLAGYQVLDEFTTKTRTIYPTPRPDGYNPAISVTYFCVPRQWAVKLGLSRESADQR